jgi:hypothetical protein
MTSIKICDDLLDGSSPRRLAWQPREDSHRTLLLGKRAPINQKSGKKIPIMNITQ